MTLLINPIIKIGKMRIGEITVEGGEITERHRPLNHEMSAKENDEKRRDVCEKS